MEEKARRQANRPNLPGYITIKDAAKTLGIASRTVYDYVTDGRLPSIQAGKTILIPIDELEKFKRGISGRPRTYIPAWRISPENNRLLTTSIFVHIKANEKAKLNKRLEEIRQKKQHLFPATIARYLIEDDARPEEVQILLVWRSSVMPDEATRQQELAAFQQELADVLDWQNARYSSGTVLMHA
ncbi:DNA-binding protein [Ktedonosporobacter rubrisoli]|uniref:DNA-binding protein n=1 Tax=Ktedonosporobacter rubrisoli TaxID=2509675 RepID=A0A4P6JZE0_KTERU|nr:helix-turn-helix domain-containing protein [Ktedonosporobacter rubrisoli]QBD80863.1 DNA-binding protein [Ktedonosporobacter rubrisoli]